jgi:hypothetical protein
MTFKKAEMEKTLRMGVGFHDLVGVGIAPV